MHKHRDDSSNIRQDFRGPPRRRSCLFNPVEAAKNGRFAARRAIAKREIVPLGYRSQNGERTIDKGR